MNTDSRKVVLIGTGMVGMSFAYALVNQGGICNELVLIDVNKERANGEAMDLNHGLAFAKSNMKIYAGDYKAARTLTSSLSQPELPRKRVRPVLTFFSAIQRSSAP